MTGMCHHPNLLSLRWGFVNILPGIAILWISASQVSRIIGVSHQCLVFFFFEKF
jgi:hypothetical protein